MSLKDVEGELPNFDKILKRPKDELDPEIAAKYVKIGNIYYNPKYVGLSDYEKKIL